MLIVAAAGCSSADESATILDSTTSPTGAISVPHTNEPVATASSSLPCSGFEQQYIGSGLTVSLPSSATPTTYAGTTEDGPVHAGAGVEFKLNGALVSIGRQLGHDDTPEPNFGKRVDSGVVVWVKSNDAELRTCLLDSTTYDAALDQQDPG